MYGEYFMRKIIITILIAIIFLLDIGAAYCASYFGFKVNGSRTMPDWSNPAWNISEEEEVEASSWTGIPEPPSIYLATYRMYDSEANRSESLTYYESPDAGYFTHYVDFNDPEATTTGVPSGYGSVAVPMSRFPSSVPAGSIVEVHGAEDDSYTYKNGGDKNKFGLLGSETYPAFMRGVDNPRIDTTTQIYGQYGVFEDFHIYEHGLGVGRADYSDDYNNICIRNCECEGDPTEIKTSTAVSSSGTGDTHHNVFYNLHVYNYGDTSISENDYHGLGTGRGAHHIWYLNCTVHDCAGDAYQTGHGHELETHHIYIGGCTFYHCGEDAVDLKDCTDIIVSDCNMYNMIRGCITISHYGSSPEGLRGTRRAWFLCNRMHEDTGSRANGVTADANEIYFIGNYVYDVEGLAFGGWTHDNVGFINNSIEDCGGGIDDSGHTYAVIVNNIFGTMTDPNLQHINLDDSDYKNASIVYNNLFKDEPDVDSPNNDYQQGDPLYVDVENYDLRVAAESDAIDNGTTSDIYDLFYEYYGVNIEIDRFGTARPQNGTWDIGAYEKEE